MSELIESPNPRLIRPLICLLSSSIFVIISPEWQYGDYYGARTPTLVALAAICRVSALVFHVMLM